MISKHSIKVILGFCGMIIIGLVLLVVFDSAKDKENVNQAANTQMTYLSTEDISWGSVNALKDKAPEVKPLSYQEALVKYKEKRIEINDGCMASPNTTSFKNNTNIMIDNISQVPKTLQIGKKVSVSANSFKIINLSSTKLPTKLVVECNGKIGVANISLYK